MALLQGAHSVTHLADLAKMLGMTALTNGQPSLEEHKDLGKGGKLAFVSCWCGVVLAVASQRSGGSLSGSII